MNLWSHRNYATQLYDKPKFVDIRLNVDFYMLNNAHFDNVYDYVAVELLNRGLQMNDICHIKNMTLQQ